MPAIPNVNTNCSPTAAVMLIPPVGPRLFVAYKESSSDCIQIVSQGDPALDLVIGPNRNWINYNVPRFISGEEPNQLKTSHGPALTPVFSPGSDPSEGLALLLGFKGHNNTKIWLTTIQPKTGGSTVRDLQWTGRGFIRDTQTAVGPSIAGASPLVVHRGNTDNSLWYSWPSRIQRDRRIPETSTDVSPAVVLWHSEKTGTPYQGSSLRAVIVFRNQHSGALMFMRNEAAHLNAIRWSTPEQIPDAWTDKKPALAMHNGLLYLAFKSRTDNQIWMGSYDGIYWKIHCTVPHIQSDEGPALVSYRDKLYVICKNHESTDIYYREAFRDVPASVYEHIKIHAIPHYFKMGDLDVDQNGRCRRRRTRKIGGVGACQSPPPVTIYPQCIPTAWARLFGAYQLILPPNQRSWEMGTPTAPNPHPYWDGDFFSTYSMGVREKDHQNPSQVQDWPDNHPIPIETINFDLASVNDAAVEERANAIENALMTIVKDRPVYIEHSGHAWNIYGVNAFGFYSHGQNRESEGLNDWCSWELAPWRKVAGRSFEEHHHLHYAIKYINVGYLKPSYRRLGCISFWIWAPGWGAHNAQFVELRSGRSIDWTPNQSDSASGAGYFWIEESRSVPDLEQESGIPIVRPADQWDSDLGQRIPVPQNTFGHCTCGSSDGCSLCRTRLNLTFWVHNITLDPHRYRVDLHVWDDNVQWSRSLAQRIASVTRSNGSVALPCFNENYLTWYGDRLPCPLPRQSFNISIRPDPSPAPIGRQPDGYDWQPFGWYIDFKKPQLDYDKTYGIRLTLTCLDNYRIQDMKQLWFKTQLR